MQKFTNETIDISALPKFEEVHLNRISSKYFNIILINISIFFGILILAFAVLAFLEEELFSNRIWLLLGIGLPVLYIVFILLYHLGFKKRGYAFREHDVIYKSGLIKESTIIIPDNRVQHVALHQGLFSRMFGLASIELFTAGGNHSDLEISGLLLADAQKIKNMISIKINEGATGVENDQNNEPFEVKNENSLETEIKSEAKNED